MAFSKSTLQADILTVFNNMGSNATNDDFANGLSNAVVAFVRTGQVSTTDVGTVPGGAFSGEGTGTLSVTATNCAKIIKDACEEMNNMTSGGNNYLAEELGKAFKKMADEGTVTTTVTGTLTPPSPSPPITPYGGSATGSISCNSTAMVQALKILFSNMYAHAGEDDYNGNLEFAKELATQLNNFWTSGRISTSGEGNIEGSSGSGSIS
mgnify:FL=1